MVRSTRPTRIVPPVSISKPPSPKTPRKTLAQVASAARAKALASPKAFSEMVWRDNAGKPVHLSRLHEAEFEFLERARAANVPAVLLAPYGSGKTEGAGSYILRLISKDPTLRVGVVCDKDEHSIDRVQMLLRYIEDSPAYRAMFPEIVVESGGRGRRTLFKFRLAQAKGKDASVEGTGVFSSPTGGRKDLLWFDDVVTKQNAINEPAQRDRIKKAFFGGWLSRLEPDGSWWFYIGTTYHADDLTSALRGTKDEPARFAVMVIGVSEDFKSYDVEEKWPGQEPVTYSIPLWEPKWSEANYRKRFEEMCAIGDQSEWLTGYRNIVTDPATAAFKERWFRREFTVSQRPSDYPFRVIFADPATTTKKRSDYYSGWVLGWDPKLRAAVALDGWYKKQGLTDRVRTYLSLVEKWAPHRCGIEGRHEVSMAERIEEVALEEHMGVRLLRLDREMDKDARIGAIAPLLEAGRILVDGQRFPWIVTEAALFPNAKHDDALDALEGAWHLVRAWLRRGRRAPGLFPLDSQGAPGARASRVFEAPVRKTAAEQVFGG